jgi:hypothetical protein
LSSAMMNTRRRMGRGENFETAGGLPAHTLEALGRDV